MNVFLLNLSKGEAEKLFKTYSKVDLLVNSKSDILVVNLLPAYFHPRRHFWLLGFQTFKFEVRRVGHHLGFPVLMFLRTVACTCPVK